MAEIEEQSPEFILFVGSPALFSGPQAIDGDVGRARSCARLPQHRTDSTLHQQFLVAEDQVQSGHGVRRWAHRTMVSRRGDTAQCHVAATAATAIATVTTPGTPDGTGTAAAGISAA